MMILKKVLLVSSLMLQDVTGQITNLPSRLRSGLKVQRENKATDTTTTPKATTTEANSEDAVAELEVMKRFLSMSTSYNPTPTPPLFPSCCSGLSYDSRKTQLFEIFSTVSDPTAIKTPGTPQYKAFNWIISDDKYCVCPSDIGCELVQRYVMAVTYFSTAGEQWTNCGAFPATSACDATLCKQGHFDRWLSNVTSCSWCGANCNSGCITAIDLDSINQAGTIPYELQNLTILETLAFQRGNVAGTIPEQLGTIKTLKDLDLNFNNLTGTIPDSIYSDPSLEQLDLNDNNLVGSISSLIGNLPNLFFVQLGNDSPYGGNDFTGTIPSELGTLTNMNYFTANNNSFIGNLPDLSNLGALRFLDVSNNLMTGTIDNTNWADIPNLQILDLSGNEFNGNIPSSFGTLSNLEFAAFDNNLFTGSMPQSVCNKRDINGGRLQNLTADCGGGQPQVQCTFPTCCTYCSD